ncbi:MAG: hypothetical protein ACLP19_22445 [Xanthobacteraceae bacterium]
MRRRCVERKGVWLAMAQAACNRKIAREMETEADQGRRQDEIAFP